MLLSTSSGTTLPVQAISASQQLAQITPNTITGQLDGNSNTLNDGSYFNVHTFEGQAGEFINIEMVSEEFDTYLLLRGPDGQTIAQDDDGGNGDTNSRIVMTLPTTGIYQILSNTYSAGTAGQYTLTWQLITEDEVVRLQALQRATALNQQAIELLGAGQISEAIYPAEEALALRREYLDDNHLAIAQSLHNLANIYRRFPSRYEEVERLYLEALAITQEQLDDSDDLALITARANSLTVSILNGLAWLNQRQERYKESEDRYLEALRIVNNHPDDLTFELVVNTLAGLSSLYHEQERGAEAAQFGAESLAVIQTQADNLPLNSAQREQLEERLDILSGLFNDQGFNYDDRELANEFEISLRQSLPALEQQWGRNHPDVLLDYYYLAHALWVQEKIFQ
ncbi:MAG: tetratricopeptide repeat protein, partial [Cyanothece sp. SIO2G6]|nr:tetratricopeptide repeat protein [Cyanothece sp. SIO2G6]